MSEFNMLELSHRCYMDAKERVSRSEKELKEAKEECLRAGVEREFGGDDNIEICNLRQELALRYWEEAIEEELNAKDELNRRLRHEVERRRPGGRAYAGDSAG